MKKIVLILALAMIWSTGANAVVVPTHGGGWNDDPVETSSGDRDCAKYSASEAKAATQDDSANTFSATFSHTSARKGTTNADCGSSSGSSNVDEIIPTHSGGSND